MFLEVPSDLVSLKDSQNFFTINDIDLIIYNNHRNYSKNEVILNKNLFLFIVAGQKNISVGNESLVLNEGCGAVVGSGAYVMTEIGSDQSGKFSSIMILVSDEALLNIWQKVQDLYEKSGDSSVNDGKYDWVFLEESHLLNSALKTIDLYLRNNKMVPHSLLDAKLKEILIYLIQSPCSSQIKQLIESIRNRNRNWRLKEFMEANFSQHWTVEQFALSYGLSLSAFKRTFKESYGVSPKSWINSRRLEQATVALSAKNIPLVNLALDLGFADSSQFSKAFKSKYKCPPSRYK
jgi:AraC-like DNA-binding protein